jgi:hypothetical protein
VPRAVSRLRLGAAVLLAAAGCAAERGPLFAPGDAVAPAGGLRGEYLRVLSFTGAGVAFERVDPTVDFDWREQAPDPRLPVDDFQIRWTGFLRAPAAGSYTLHTRSDDGVRLWLDERLAIDNWNNHLETEDAATVVLPATLVPITLHFYEHERLATIRLLWSSPTTPPVVVPASALSPRDGAYGLTARYYLGRDFETLRATTVDLEIAFDWGLEAPHPDVPANGFSVRWQGTALPRHSETYTFYTRGKETNERVRLTVADAVVIDDWTSPHAVENSGTVALQAGRAVSLVLEYAEDIGAAGMVLEWSSASQPRAAISWHRLRP